MSRKINRWILVIVWAGLIFFFSSQPDLKSNLPGEWDFVLRKIVHFTEYFVLTFLLIRALEKHGLSRKKTICLAVCLAVLFAISDEYHQTFVHGRQGAFKDVLIDSLGVILASFLYKKR